MNINVYVEDELGHNLGDLAKKTGKSRNSIVREAIQEYIAKQMSAKWSEKILAFQGIDEGIEFESYREDLLPPNDEGMFS